MVLSFLSASSRTMGSRYCLNISSTSLLRFSITSFFGRKRFTDFFPLGTDLDLLFFLAEEVSEEATLKTWVGVMPVMAAEERGDPVGAWVLDPDLTDLIDLVFVEVLEFSMLLLLDSSLPELKEKPLDPPE